MGNIVPSSAPHILELTRDKVRLRANAEVAYTDDTEAEYKLDTMVHGFWASGVTDVDTIRNTVATFRMNYRLSFTGHESETAKSFETVVPLVRRTTVYGHW